MVYSARSPCSHSASVRGMGVAVMYITWGDGVAFAASLALCSTPNLHAPQPLVREGMIEGDGHAAKAGSAAPCVCKRKQTIVRAKPALKGLQVKAVRNGRTDLCCSSTMASPRLLNWTLSLMRACVPTTMSMLPSATPAVICTTKNQPVKPSHLPAMLQDKLMSCLRASTAIQCVHLGTPSCPLLPQKALARRFGRFGRTCMHPEQGACAG